MDVFILTRVIFLTSADFESLKPFRGLKKSFTTWLKSSRYKSFWTIDDYPTYQWYYIKN